MGGCQIYYPCSKDIKKNESCPVILNNSRISQEEQKVSNEEIKIDLPVSPLAKISNNNINPFDKNDNLEIKNKENNKDIININDLTDKNDKSNNNNSSFENIQIDEIISKEKIHTKNNHEIVFRGNLLLLSKTGDFEKLMIYCVMSRINLKLYKDINFFLKMKKPLYIIDLSSAKNIQIIKDNELGLCFSISDKYIFNSQNKEQLYKWIVLLNYFSHKL